MAETQTVLQFGTGRFLRGFFDLFVHESNQIASIPTQIVAVQSTSTDRVIALTRNACRYSAYIRGIFQGNSIDEKTEVSSISEALSASESWNRVLDIARSPSLAAIVSNTSERGYEVESSEKREDLPPRSYPAKLLACLKARSDAGQPPVLLLPLELFENNASKLLGTVLRLAERFHFSSEVIAFVKACRWCSSLVDRIITAGPSELSASEPMSVTAEPFAFWAIQSENSNLDLPISHPAMTVTSDIAPYFLRKVRILNAAHTALVSKAMPMGFRTVREAVEDTDIFEWLHALIFDEIVPTIAGRVPNAEMFAQQVLERFRNPFHNHLLADIAFAHAEKFAIRIVPTFHEYSQTFGHTPKRLGELMALTSEQSSQ